MSAGREFQNTTGLAPPCVDRVNAIESARDEKMHHMMNSTHITRFHGISLALLKWRLALLCNGLYF